MKDFINEKLVATTSEEIFADQVLIGFLHLDKIAIKQVLWPVNLQFIYLVTVTI